LLLPCPLVAKSLKPLLLLPRLLLPLRLLLLLRPLHLLRLLKLPSRLKLLLRPLPRLLLLLPLRPLLTRSNSAQQIEKAGITPLFLRPEFAS
jgi:hypothetical protein